MGHQISLVALNDRFLTNCLEELQDGDNTPIPVLRLPSSWKHQARLTKAKEWIAIKQPDWLSLQFVPYAFHDKGIPFHFAKDFQTLAQAARKHIMFHELWIGIDHHASIKEKIIGRFQKKIIKNIIQTLRPTIIHTQSSYYQFLLSEFEPLPSILPLFSNIPLLDTANTKIPLNYDLHFVVFGNIHHGAAIGNFSADASDFAKRSGNKVFLTLAGSNGPEKKKWIREWSRHGNPYSDEGRCSTEKLSNLFLSATHGISTTPSLLIEKSGAVTAMIEHGLPIISLAREWGPKNMPHIAPSIISSKYAIGKFEECLSSTLNPINTTHDVACQLLLDLSKFD